MQYADRKICMRDTELMRKPSNYVLGIDFFLRQD